VTGFVFPRMLIAEIGSVHDGSFGNARELVKLAVDCGADMVKFQMHVAEAETLADAPMPPYFKSEPRYDYFRRTAFSFEQWADLKQLTESLGAVFTASAFSSAAVAILERLGVTMHKVPSGDVNNLPLLRDVAATGKPVLLSSGMSTWAEIDGAMALFRDAGSPVLLMQCASAYPCPPEEVGLNVLAEMRVRYGCPVGLSDHTAGISAAVAAVALGAVAVEKHLAFSRLMYGSDARHSLEPAEFRALSRAVRETWSMLDSPVDKGSCEKYSDMKRIFEKSIVTTVPLHEGVRLREEHLDFRRPGDGIPAALYREIVGRKVRRALPAGHKLSEADLE